MDPSERDNLENELPGGANNNVIRNNEAEAKLYAASKNKKMNLSASVEDATPSSPPSIQEEQSYSEAATPTPTYNSPLHHYQRNPQATGSLTRAVTTGAHRPQRLNMPAVLTTPNPHMNPLGQNAQMYPPPYFPQANPRMPGPIVQQPGMQGRPGMMGAPQLGQGMVMATYENGWAVPPQNPVSCPPGLEYLAEVDQILIHQQIEILELLTGFETKNKYMIRNTLGQSIYFASEESGCCSRQCLGPTRPFEMNFYDHYGNIVMTINRPYACGGCCCPCCLHNVEVSAPPGNVIGSVHQNWHLLFPRFSVKDAHGSTLMKIHGPFCTASCCCKDVDYEIKSPNAKEDVGKITKQWGGFLREAYTDADNFSLSFPLDMDITAKALLLASVFLIDFMFYETKNNN